MRAIIGLWALLAAMALAGCDSVARDDRAPNYRYRLTVEVDTPEGLRTGSSVIEVEQNMGRSGASPAHGQIYYRVRGEAVAVDLPGEKTLFALLRSENDVGWSARVMQMISPNVDGEAWEDVFDNVLLVEGEVEVPQTWPANAVLPERSAYPMLVTFGNFDDPVSVEMVDPDDLAATFGKGYALERITVQLTEYPVTTGIEERLRWIGKPFERHLQTEDFPAGLPVGDLDGLFKKPS